jgi:hypothetical protein
MNDRAERLFRHAWGGKLEQHWVLCLSSYLMSANGGVQKMAQEYGLHEQTIRNYGKTYLLYSDLREWARHFYTLRLVGQQIAELRQLRKDVHYSNWLLVAERVYHENESIRIGYEQALDFLRAGSDISARPFAAMIGANDLTRTKAFASALSGLMKALTFPMPKRDRRILKRAAKIVEKRGR